jgi:hypothetical protein
MALTYKLDDGDTITLLNGPQDISDGLISTPCMLLELHGRARNGGTMVLLDAEARAWLRTQLAEWDR